MKLIELKNIINTYCLVDIPEKEIMVTLDSNIFILYGNRDVINIYIDRADNDLCIEIDFMNKENIKEVI